MKYSQMRSDFNNILAVVIEHFGISGSLITTYTIFYKSGVKRSFKNPSFGFRSRFDWWYRCLDYRDVDYQLFVLLPMASAKIPDSVFVCFPILEKEV